MMLAVAATKHLKFQVLILAPWKFQILIQRALGQFYKQEINIEYLMFQPQYGQMFIFVLLAELDCGEVTLTL